MFILLMILAAAAAIGITLSQDILIVQRGILSYRRIRTAVYLIAGIMMILSIAGITVSRRKEAREMAIRAAQKKEENEGKPPADLAVSSRLDDQKIQNLLFEKMEGEWNVCSKEAEGCLAQMQTMDRYQEKLNRLLKENGADALNDTEEILDRVEQYLCKNVRKVLNFMSVADPSDASDQEMIRSKLLQCSDKNRTQLEQTQQFLFALTEFLNQQGDDDSGEDLLEMYRQTILDSLSREV